jgi:hypothetical protein
MASTGLRATDAIGLTLLTVLTIAVLVSAAARFYAGSALRFGGCVKLSDAWRGTSH